MAHRGVDAAEVGLEAAVLVQVPQEGGAFDGLRRDQAGVGVVEQVEGVLAQHEGGGRLGAEDRPALAGQVGQEPQVVLHRVAGRLHVAVGQRRHAAADLAGRHVDLDAVVVQHGRHRLGDGRIVIVGEDIHEVGDARPGGARPARPAAAPGVAEEAAPGEGRQPAAARHAEQLFQQPADGAAGQQRVGDRGEGAAEAGEHLGARHGPVGAVEAVAGRVGGLGLQHEARHVDVGRALDRAHLAVDAQVGHGPHLVRGQPRRVGVRLEQAAHEVRLGPRRGGLVRRRPEDRAHAQGRFRRSGNGRSRCSCCFPARPRPGRQRS